MFAQYDNSLDRLARRECLIGKYFLEFERKPSGDIAPDFAANGNVGIGFAQKPQNIVLVRVSRPDVIANNPKRFG